MTDDAEEEEEEEESVRAAEREVKSLWPLSGSTADDRQKPTSSPSGSNSLRRFHEFTAAPGGGDPLTKSKLLTKIGTFLKCQAFLKHSSGIRGINASWRSRRNTDDLCCSFTAARLQG